LIPVVKAHTLRNVLIPKEGTSKMLKRGIPTMHDSAMQALHELALQPLVGTLAAPNSYGFRLYRICDDAIEYCFNSLTQRGSLE
jgi:RNA-directed DNA polymerase